MGFRKNYNNGVKYNYAVVEEINYMKDSFISANLIIYEKDDDVLTSEDLLAIPNEEKHLYEAVNIEEEFSAENPPTYTKIPIETSKMAIRIELKDSNDIKQAKKDLIKFCYNWIKNNLDLFKDGSWSDA